MSSTLLLAVNNLPPSLLQLHNLKPLEIISARPQSLLSQVLSPSRPSPLAINISSSPSFVNSLSPSAVQEIDFEFSEHDPFQVDFLPVDGGGVDDDVVFVDDVADGGDLVGVLDVDDSAEFDKFFEDHFLLKFFA